MKKIVGIFITWRIILFIILFFAVSIVPLQLNFLGGGLSRYLHSPQFWSWVNFDGEHYLAIAQRGYKDLEYFYFPLFPLVVGLMAKWADGQMVKYAFTGLVVSHAAFLAGLVGLVRLIKLDYKEEVAFYTVILLLIFPTSFYFASFYTESLFFALCVWSFYFARKKKWLLAGLFGGLSTATRIVGLALLPAFLVEIWQQKKNGRFKKASLRELLGILLVPLGLLIYMNYLRSQTSDPLEFLHSVSIFGQQRSSNFVVLPQVFYRYIFKILPEISYDFFPVVFNTWLEIVVAIVFGALGILGCLGSLGLTNKFKFRLSYATYLFIGYLIPTLSGSFSSLPRYVLILFPAYVLLAIYFSRLPKILQFFIYILLFTCLAVSTGLYIRGYWVA